MLPYHRGNDTRPGDMNRQAVNSTGVPVIGADKRRQVEKK
jgi:hypothetical protein